MRSTFKQALHQGIDNLNAEQIYHISELTERTQMNKKKDINKTEKMQQVFHGCIVMSVLKHDIIHI